MIRITTLREVRFIFSGYDLTQVEIPADGYADLKKLLDRGLNTWDDAPTWLITLSDHLERELQKGA